MRLPGRLNSVDVAIGIPPVSINGSFSPTTAERDCAWELLVELSSRTSVAPLLDDEGSTREALSSLYTLYQTTRDLLRKYGGEVAAPRRDGNLSLGLIAMRVLNDILRPLMSKYHPLLEAHEAGRPAEIGKAEWESRWERNADCRRELTEIRRSVRSYIDTLGAIAGTPDLADAVVPLPPAVPVPSTRVAKRSKPLDVREHMVRWVSVFEGGWIGWVKARSKAICPSGPAPAEVPFDDWCTDLSQQDDCWVDYVADLGDAFDPTMAVAWQLGRASIALPADRAGEHPAPPDGGLPRGQLLVMGGDEVYPSASAERYRRQLQLPYGLALEPSGPRPAVIALPGNHDWMGGIEHFERVFVGENAEGLGGWTAGQSKRWFCVKLPGGWWMWGLDSGLGNELGEEQQAYFAAAAEQLGPDDRVVLCTAVPLWQMRAKREEEYTELRQLLRDWLGARADAIPVFLSGDSHYFAVYESTDARRPELHVTSGGGGAFLHPTHSLPARVPFERGHAEFDLRSRWPSPADSRAVSPSARLLRDRQSIGIVPGIGLLFALFLLSAGNNWLGWGADEPGGWPLPFGFVVSNAINIAVLLLLVVAGRLTIAPNARERLVARGAKLFGVAHGVLLAGVFWAAAAGLFWVVDTWLDLTGAARIAVFAAGSLAAGAITYALFLRVVGWIGNRYRMNDNLAFAAVRSVRYKHFVRMRFSADGSLTLYGIGLDPIGRTWSKAFDNGRSVPPPDPDGTPMLHYIWGAQLPARPTSAAPDTAATRAEPVLETADSSS